MAVVVETQYVVAFKQTGHGVILGTDQMNIKDRIDMHTGTHSYGY